MWNVSDALGKFFFVAGLMPSLAFMAACDLVIVPRLLNGQHLVDIKFLGIEGAVYVVGGTFLSFLLLTLNTHIIRFYENGFLLSPWLKRRNLELHRRRYTALAARRETYRRAVETGIDLEASIAKLEAVHDQVEAQQNPGALPHGREVVMPTALGNIFAVMEEYPYERYGMDAMVYWPRLTAVISEDYKAQISDLKSTLDFLLNLSLLAGLFGLAALAVAAAYRQIPDLIYGLFALVIAYILYSISIQPARELGEVVMSCFDLFRGGLLEKYGQVKPSNLIAERQLWRQLASFTRRGEEFYFPLDSSTEGNRSFLQQELSYHTYSLSHLNGQATLYAAGEVPLHLLDKIDAEQQAIKEIKAKLIMRK